MSIRSAIILGLGSSGEAAARLIAARGGKVRVLDQGSSDALRQRAEKLLAVGVEVALGKPGRDAFLLDGKKPDACIVSPGIPGGSSMLTIAEDLSLNIISELDFGFSYVSCPVIAVTGSNGKSTLVKLLDDTLRELGMHSMPCGNYGDPVSAAVMQEDMDRLVVEVSTFQMELTESFAPQTGVLLNLQPNHLDRHPDMDVYSALKAKMFQKMEPAGISVVNKKQVELVKNANSNIEIVTIGNDEESDFSYADGKISGRGVQVDVGQTFLDNPIMGLTGSAALAVVVENGWDPGALEEAVRRFVPLDCRMQERGMLNGVKFINNSKATTLAALEASLSMAQGPVRLVAGGKLKEKDLKSAKKMLVKTVASAYLYGEAGECLERAWSDSVRCYVVKDLDSAVKRAYGDATKGDVVLLSPGCSSFDQFSGYAERGEVFNRVLEELRRVSL